MILSEKLKRLVLDYVKSDLTKDLTRETELQQAFSVAIYSQKAFTRNITLKDCIDSMHTVTQQYIATLALPALVSENIEAVVTRVFRVLELENNIHENETKKKKLLTQISLTDSKESQEKLQEINKNLAKQYAQLGHTVQSNNAHNYYNKAIEIYPEILQQESTDSAIEVLKIYAKILNNDNAPTAVATANTNIPPAAQEIVDTNTSEAPKPVQQPIEIMSHGREESLNFLEVMVDIMRDSKVNNLNSLPHAKKCLFAYQNRTITTLSLQEQDDIVIAMFAYIMKSWKGLGLQPLAYWYSPRHLANKLSYGLAQLNYTPTDPQAFQNQINYHFQEVMMDGYIHNLGRFFVKTFFLLKIFNHFDPMKLLCNTNGMFDIVLAQKIIYKLVQQLPAGQEPTKQMFVIFKSPFFIGLLQGLRENGIDGIQFMLQCCAQENKFEQGLLLWSIIKVSDGGYSEHGNDLLIELTEKTQAYIYAHCPQTDQYAWKLFDYLHIINVTVDEFDLAFISVMMALIKECIQDYSQPNTNGVFTHCVKPILTKIAPDMVAVLHPDYKTILLSCMKINFFMLKAAAFAVNLDKLCALQKDLEFFLNIFNLHGELSKDSLFSQNYQQLAMLTNGSSSSVNVVSHYSLGITFGSPKSDGEQINIDVISPDVRPQQQKKKVNFKL